MGLGNRVQAGEAMTGLLCLIAVCYAFSGVVLAFLMATPYRLRVPTMFIVALFWPLVILIAAVDRRGR